MLEVEVVKIQVTSLSENTFYGRIHLRKEGIEEFDIDARPSDAIALALRYKVPIFVHKDVYESAAIQVKETGAGEEAAEAETETKLPSPCPAADRMAGLPERRGSPWADLRAEGPQVPARRR